LGKNNYIKYQLNDLEIDINAMNPVDLKEATLTLDNFFFKKSITLDKFFKTAQKKVEDEKPKVYSFFTLRNILWITGGVAFLALVCCGYWYLGKRRESLIRKKIEKDKNYIYDIDDYTFDIF
jgi:hypothetical protein